MAHSPTRSSAAPGSRRRQRHARKEATRADLLRRAAARVRAGGFGALRTADVARDAGLSHGALFVHFPTRDRLLTEVAAGLRSEITDELHRLAAEGADLRTALAAHVAAVAAHEPAYRSLLIEATAGGVLRDAWIGLQSAIAHHLAPAFERSGASPSARQPLRFNTWLGLIHHYVLNADLFAPGKRSVLAAHGDELVDFYLGLVADSGKERP